jgi:hypothetical protein
MRQADEGVEERLRRLETALARIQDECERALETPQLVVLTVCRVASVARQALDEEEERAA